MALREAVEEGGRRRLRPILMTTLTTALALTPMALGIGEGSEMQAPMARVVIGGLLVSTLITLVFVPTVYTIVEDKLDQHRQWRVRSRTGNNAFGGKLSPEKYSCYENEALFSLIVFS